MPYSSSLTDKEWVLSCSIVAKKKDNLSYARGAKDKYWTVYSINCTMVVIGLIYPAYLPPSKERILAGQTVAGSTGKKKLDGQL